MSAYMCGMCPCIIPCTLHTLSGEIHITEWETRPFIFCFCTGTITFVYASFIFINTILSFIEHFADKNSQFPEYLFNQNLCFGIM